MSIKYTFKNQGDKISFEKPGTYDVKIINAFEKIATRGHDVIVLTVQNQSDVGETIFDELHFTEAASWRIDVLLKATGLAEGMEEGHECVIKPEIFVGRSGKVRVDWEEYEKDGQKKRVLKIKGWIIPRAKKESDSKDNLNY